MIKDIKLVIKDQPSAEVIVILVASIHPIIMRT